MKRKVLIYVGIALLLVGLYVVNQEVLNVSPEWLREWILSFGWFAPVVYIIAYTFRPLILFPASVLSITGGLAFGPLFGTLYTLIGASGSAAVAFLVARKLGKNIAGKEWKGKGEVIQTQLEKRGFFYVLVLRLIPLFNFDLISYAAGVSKVRFSPFLFATIIGMTPGIFAFTFLGSSFVDGGASTWILAIGLFFIVMLVPLFFKEKVRLLLGLEKKKGGRVG
ncbi:TVP38/TMEM64 family protein [Alteribacter aurantiacus]|uniref:TVP38/TMEM64 family protein n=1 Tax=Alteribacter aurantiacus TaxID=254410 RepID=UPI000406E351|nr:TVP38/TMEM64 family protein [Alteribacter aurantiacus]